MKTLFIAFIIAGSIFAREYTNGKIDMHGGDYEEHYPRKAMPAKKSFACMADFLDKNSSQTQEPTPPK